MDPSTGWCVGCARTLEEIAAWSTLPDAQKLAVWKALPARRDELASRGLLEGTAKPAP